MEAQQQKEKEVKPLLDEDFKKIQELTQTYNALTNRIGSSALEIRELEAYLAQAKANYDQLLSKYDATKQQETTLVEELNKKYGKGEINLESKTITVTK